jgi:hypothetical protein
VKHEHEKGTQEEREKANLKHAKIGDSKTKERCRPRNDEDAERSLPA